MSENAEMCTTGIGHLHISVCKLLRLSGLLPHALAAHCDVNGGANDVADNDRDEVRHA